MRKEIQIICVGNPEFGDCGEALTLSTEHEIVCPVCGTSYTAECARRQAVRQDSDKVFNVIIHDDGELTTAALQEAANEEVAAQNCRENPAMFDSFYILADSFETANNNLWRHPGEGRRILCC